MTGITTAVIPVGGLGTRFYPLTKTLRKYLLPVYDRPVIDYLLDNCIEAGIQHVVFVVMEGDLQLAHYLGEDVVLKQALTSRGKGYVYTKLIAPLHKRIKTTIVEQPLGTNCGTAAAILFAQKHLPADEPFMVMMGDNFLWRADGGSDIADMITSYQNSGAAGACMVEHAQTFSGLQCNAAVTLRPGAGQYRYLQDIVEKPTRDVRPRLGSVGRYIFEPSIFAILHSQEPDKDSGEYYLPDTIKLLSQQSLVLVHTIQGRQLDCGIPKNWLRTNNFIARQRLKTFAVQPAPGIAPGQLSTPLL